MRKAVILIAMVITFISCDKTKKSDEMDNTSTENNMSNTPKNQLFACPMHLEVTGKKGDKCSKCGMELTEPVVQKKVGHNQDKSNHSHEDVNATSSVAAQNDNSTVATKTFSIEEIVANYLKIKNALTKDDAKGAANAGKALYKTFSSINVNALNANQKKEYLDISDDAKEHAEHIGDNAGKIDHQREHFVILSKDINDLINSFGTQQKLYQDFCPMANDGKGAIWISEVKEIKNPYYGSQMFTCGSIKKTF